MMRVGKKAIVIGGSMAGKLAARVLSDFFETVTILEKDEQPEKFSIRAGVPQGAHGHALLKKGEELLEQLFPGIIDDLIQDGSVRSDFAEELSWYHHGRWKMKYHSGISIIQQSRPFLDWHIDRRLKAISNIRCLYGHKADRLILDKEGTKVIAVEASHANEESQQIEADLIVDASGVGSKTPLWLRELGLQEPKTTEIKVELTYSSRIYKRPEAYANWKSLLVYPNPPAQTRGGGIFPIENDQWMVTLLGYGEKSPPTNEKEFKAFAASLDDMQVYRAIEGANPVSDVKTFRFPSQVRRHYEKLRTFPKNLIITGDAFCRFDPVFGQGMTVAISEAVTLQRMLANQTISELPHHFSTTFHKKLARLVSVPWLMVLCEDFRFPHTQGKKPWMLPILSWYIKKVILACTYDRNVYDRFTQVLHLKKHPLILFHPSVVFALLRRPM